MKGRPDNPITQSGIAGEFRNQAWRTRFGQHRTDLKHQPVDIVMWAAPYLALAGGVYLLIRASRSHHQ